MKRDKKTLFYADVGVTCNRVDDEHFRVSVVYHNYDNTDIDIVLVQHVITNLIHRKYMLY